jgi:hypothetical protein
LALVAGGSPDLCPAQGAPCMGDTEKLFHRPDHQWIQKGKLNFFGHNYIAKYRGKEKKNRAIIQIVGKMYLVDSINLFGVIPWLCFTKNTPKLPFLM